MTDNDKAPEVQKNMCGCTMTRYPDGRNIYAPCPPCGIYKAAEQLRATGEHLRRSWSLRARRAGRSIDNAAMALAAVATTLQNEQRAEMKRAQLVEVARGAASGGDKCAG